MTAPTAALVSFRLGGTDGVSVEARKWEWALRELGFDVKRVAGELEDGLRPDDVWLPFLAIEPPPGAAVEPDTLSAALAGTDLVVVENLCSLPLNPTASYAAAAVLSEHDGRVAFHHHDLPWERPGLGDHPELPPRRPESLHVAISDQAREALGHRGIDALTIRNAFDPDAPEGDRVTTRSERGFEPDDLVVLQPARAIPRKNVGAGIAFAERLARLVPGRTVRYWLTGPAEEGYGAELERLVASADVPVTLGRARRPADAYAAADVVVYPSSWEGFGNPVAEAALARRPIVVGRYPALEELIGMGLRCFPVEEPDAVARWLDHPDAALLDANSSVVRSQLSLTALPGRIVEAFGRVGWTSW